MLNVGLFLSEQHNRGRSARPALLPAAVSDHVCSTSVHLPMHMSSARRASPRAAWTAALVGIAFLLIVLGGWRAASALSASSSVMATSASGTLRSDTGTESVFFFAVSGALENATYAGAFYSDAALQRGLSPWHDVPLYASRDEDAVARGDAPVHFVCEIPRFTRAKFEVTKADLPFNRIMQDRDAQGIPRVLAYGDYFVNYGMLPQTFEDPKILAGGTKLLGDGDPIDALELGAFESVYLTMITPA